MICPQWGSEHTKKNGSIHNKKQKYQYNSCGRQFVENPQNKIIDDKTKNLIDKLLLEKISLIDIVIFQIIKFMFLTETQVIKLTWKTK